MRDEVFSVVDQDEIYYASLVAKFSADAIVITDTDGNALWVNDAFCKVTEYSFEEVEGKPPCVLLSGADTSDKTVELIQQARRERRQFQTEILQYTKSGREMWFEVRINPVFDENGVHTHFVETERDVTARKELEIKNGHATAVQQLRKKERRLVAQTSEWLHSTKSLPELLKVIEASMTRIFPDASGALYVYSNSRDTLDLAASWGEDAPTRKNIAPDSCWGLRRGRHYSFGASEIEFPCDHHMDGTTPSLCLPIMAHGETIGLLHLCFHEMGMWGESREDVREYLEQKREMTLVCAEQISLSMANVQLRQELQDQSTRDPLTSLWNRRWFLETASSQLARAREQKSKVSILSIDVDHFKKFNDQYGHDAGDLALREVGALMTSHFTENAHSCRIGGEEFVVLCIDTDQEAAADMAETFRAALAGHTVKYGRQDLPRITASIGVASFPEDGADVLTLMRAGDEALYAAKDAGRNQIVRVGDLRNTVEYDEDAA
ncbi:MAG: diguanylate cyclase [Pseudomonadota bacterium]